MTPLDSPAEQAKKVRLLVVDDHTLFREGLCALLRQHGGFEIVAEAASGPDAIEAARSQVPDVVIMDVAMPGLSGPETARRIRKARPATGVLMLSIHGEEQFIVRSLEVGCAGYLLKSASAPEVYSAIAEVAAGRRAFSPEALETVISSLIRRCAEESSVAASRSPLTEREREVIGMISQGKASREIALDLHLSVKTVETHRANIMRKLDLHTVAGMVRYAMAQGITVPRDGPATGT